MKRYYVPMMLVLNNAYSNNVTKNKTTYDNVVNTLKNTKVYNVFYDEIKITEQLAAYLELESMKTNNDVEIRKHSDEGGKQLQKMYTEYQKLAEAKADSKKLENYYKKIQVMTQSIEQEIQAIQQKFQVASSNKIEEIRRIVDDAVQYVCSQIKQKYKKASNQFDNIIVYAIDKSFVKGINDQELVSLNITDEILNYLKEKNLLKKDGYRNDSSKSKNGNSTAGKSKGRGR